MDDTNRVRLAQLMEARREKLGLTWEQVALKGSITDETLRQVRRNRRVISRGTRRAIEAGLDWATGSVDQILSGGDPQPLPEPADLPGLPSGDLPAMIDYLSRLDYPPADRRRMVAQVLRIDHEAREADRRAAG